METTAGATANTAPPLAVVTGGASGIGAATARRLATAGYALALLDVSMEGAEAVARSIVEAGGKARAYACDVGEIASIETAAATVMADHGAPAVLVTAAGIIPNTESILDMDVAAHDRMWRINYAGTLHACRIFGRQMVANQRGAIVTLTSINAMRPLPIPAYNMGKAAVQRMTELLAVELGRHGIRVNSVAPTYVMTPPLLAKVAAGERDMNKIMSVHALPYLPEPSDIANAVAFLVSDEARAIAGIMLPVDSGWSCGVSYRTYAGGVPWQG